MIFAVVKQARSMCAAVMLVAFQTSATTAKTPEKPLITLKDLQGLNGSDYTRISPDGEKLVYTAYTPDQTLWLIEARPGSVARALGKGFLPTWSPDGKRIAYYCNKSGSVQLWMLDLTTNRAEQLTRLKGGVDPDIWARISGSIYDPFHFSWSPDSTRVIFTSRVAVTGRTHVQGANRDSAQERGAKADLPLVLNTITPPEWTLSGIFVHGFGSLTLEEGALARSANLKRLPPATNQLFIVDVRKKTLNQLTADDAGYFTPDWSPDGTRIVCASNEGSSLHAVGSALSATNIVVIDLATHNKMVITTGAGYKRLPKWSPDGARIGYLSGDRLQPVSAFVVASTGGAAVNATSSLDRYIEEFEWWPDGASLLITYRNGVSYEIARASLTTGDIKIIDGKESATRWSVTVSRSGVVAWLQSDPAVPASIQYVPPGNRGSSPLTDLNSQVKGWQLGVQEIVRWKNHRNEGMEGILLKPVDYQNGRRYPLIVDVYPGVANSFAGNAMSANQSWASRGYAIFFPNARAPHTWMNPFKGRDFDQAAKGPGGWDVTFDDVMSGVDELIMLGIADPNRLGLYGFSNGGAVVNYLVTRTNRFRCAVSVAGALSDWVRPALLEPETGLDYFEGGMTLWDDPEAYLRLSAVFHTNQVTTPMLLAAGDEDGDFLLDTIEMYNSLRRFGAEVTFLRYPDQEHGFTGAALKDFWDRESAFFDKYLTPKEATN